MSLWTFFSSKDKVLDFFLGFDRNVETYSNLTCYVENSTLIMYLSMKKIKLSIMNVPLNYNMFK